MITAKCLVRLSANQSIPHNVITVLQLDTVVSDPGDNFDIETYRFTAPFDGSCDIKLLVGWNNAGVVADKAGFAEIRVNGARAAWGQFHSSQTGVDFFTPVPTGLILSAGDWIDTRVYHNMGAACPAWGGVANSHMFILLFAD